MTSPSPPPYRETLRVPVSWWLFGLLGGFTVWWVCFVAFAPGAAAGAALLTASGVAFGLWRYGGLEVRLSASGLHAGRATLPWEYVAGAQVLDSEDTRRVLGVDADARAHLVFRSYCPGAVRVEVDDEMDPAPYWLISSRHPAQLADRVGAWSVRD